MPTSEEIIARYYVGYYNRAPDPVGFEFWLDAYENGTSTLGSRLIEFHSQNKTVAASMIAEKKVSGHRSYRVATRRQSFNRPNMISMRLRRL